MTMTAEARSPAVGLKLTAASRELGRWTIAIVGPLVVFGILAWIKGAQPIDVYSNMLKSIFTKTSVGEILVKATPILLAGLAVAVPARAGLVNVGGEGQLVIGAVAAYGVSLMMGDGLPGWLVLTMMVIGAGVFGALW